MTARKTAAERPMNGRPAKHAGRMLERVLRENRLDMRSKTARVLHTIMADLADDRAGWESCSAGERLLIEQIAVETLILRAIGRWALRQPSLIEDGDDGPRLIGPLAKGFTSHLGAMTRALTALGIRPDKIDRLPDLSEYIAEHERGNGTRGAQNATASDDHDPAGAEVSADEDSNHAGDAARRDDGGEEL